MSSEDHIESTDDSTVVIGEVWTIDTVVYSGAIYLIVIKVAVWSWCEGSV